jgi:hypothetical protein
MQMSHRPLPVGTLVNAVPVNPPATPTQTAPQSGLMIR